MKTKQGFNLREMCGENIIVAEGEANIDFSNIISMNESAAYLWRRLQQLPAFTVDTMADLMLEEYDVDKDTARTDCAALAATWAEAGIIEGDDCPQPAVRPPSAAVQPARERRPLEQVAAVQAGLHPQPAAPQAKRKGFFQRLFGR